MMASLVLYFALIPFVDISFDEFIGVFIIAQVLGVFRQVPGGLGDFEGLFLLILPGENNAAHLFGALIADRIIYHVLPLNYFRASDFDLRKLFEKPLPLGRRGIIVKFYLNL